MKIAQENIERIYKVVRFIEQAIEQEMSLESLASIACFSPFHFQRLFKDVMNESPKQFIKRLRLEEAARIIAFNYDQNIFDVAIQVGFQSLEAFSRAFKDYYAVSPDNYRKCNEIERINISMYPYQKKVNSNEIKIELASELHQIEFQDLQINIVSKALMRCVYLQTTLNSPQLITENYKRIKLWSQAYDLVKSDILFVGIIKDYPIFTSLDKCRFLTCVHVSENVKVSGLVNYIEIPASKYVTFNLVGNIQNVIKTASYIVHWWLPQSAFKLKLEPILQVPLNDPSLTPFNENSYQIYIPVQAV